MDYLIYYLKFTLQFFKFDKSSQPNGFLFSVYGSSVFHTMCWSFINVLICPRRQHETFGMRANYLYLLLNPELKVHFSFFSLSRSHAKQVCVSFTYFHRHSLSASKEDDTHKCKLHRPFRLQRMAWCLFLLWPFRPLEFVRY